MTDNFERWLGKADATLLDHERRLDHIDQHLGEIARSVNSLERTISKLMVVVPLILILANALVALSVWAFTHSDSPLHGAAAWLL